jgi:hypothetical protein
MNTSNIQNLPICSVGTEGKSTNKVDDRTTFYQFLSDKTTSCTDVAETTGIRQKCCTQYKRFWEKLGKLQVIKHERCPHTGRKVQIITTNQEFFIKPTGVQTNLFEQ